MAVFFCPHTIQTAFREISDALTARSAYVDQAEAQDRNVSASQDYDRLARMRFDAGLDTYLTALDAQRTLYAAQQAQVSARQAQAQNLVSLYIALGGGWREFEATKPKRI